MGISNFGKTVTIRAQDFEATYYGEPSDAESLVSMAYSGGTFSELIQAAFRTQHVSGLS